MFWPTLPKICLGRFCCSAYGDCNLNALCLHSLLQTGWSMSAVTYQVPLSARRKLVHHGNWRPNKEPNPQRTAAVLKLCFLWDTVAALPVLNILGFGLFSFQWWLHVFCRNRTLGIFLVKSSIFQGWGWVGWKFFCWALQLKNPCPETALCYSPCMFPWQEKEKAADLVASLLDPVLCSAVWAFRWELGTCFKAARVSGFNNLVLSVIRIQCDLLKGLLLGGSMLVVAMVSSCSKEVFLTG